MDTTLDSLIRACMLVPGDAGPRGALAGYLGEKELHDLEQIPLLNHPNGRWLMPGRNQLAWAVHYRQAFPDKIPSRYTPAELRVRPIIGILIVPDALSLHSVGVYCSLCRREVGLCCDVGPTYEDRHEGRIMYQGEDLWTLWEEGWRWWCDRCRPLPTIIEHGVPKIELAKEEKCVPDLKSWIQEAKQ